MNHCEVWKNQKSFILYSASVRLVSVDPLTRTAVQVTWTPLNNLPVDHYTVYYSIIVNDGRSRRQTAGSVTFSASVSSGVVPGLLEGQQYQFSVGVTLSVGGVLYMSVPGPPLTGMCNVYVLVASSGVITISSILEFRVCKYEDMTWFLNINNIIILQHV